MDSKKLEIFGILTAMVSLLIFVSLIGYNPNEDPGISPNIKVENPMGILGVWIGYALIKLSFGYISLLLPFLIMTWGIWFFSNKSFEKIYRISIFVLISIILGSLTVGFYQISFVNPNDQDFLYSGMIGGLLAGLFFDFLGFYGFGITLLFVWLVFFRSIYGASFYIPIKDNLSSFVAYLKKSKKGNKAKRKDINTNNEIIEGDQLLIHNEDKDNIVIHSENDKSTDEKIEAEKGVTEIYEEVSIQSNASSEESIDNLSKNEIEKSDKNIDENSDIEKESKSIKTSIEVGQIASNKEVDFDKLNSSLKAKMIYKLPSSDLLANPSNVQNGMSKEELVDRANFLQQSLETFGVMGNVVNVSPGPVITLFEVEPAEGVRVNKFVALSDDLARVMEASRVRVIAPIPGKSSVGIEIPNQNPDMVYLKSVINSENFSNSESKLTLAIGKNTIGEIATLDLAKMPHLLIAGTTGSGKSVCINTILASLLYQSTPDEVKFVIIDPKKVEMAVYRELSNYHLLKIEGIDESIVTTPDNAVLALRAVEKEMGKRYDILAGAVVRNISEYNKKMTKSGEPLMPFIVVLIDELADLMMLNAKEVEAPIARLAQLARAVGIHLVVATQRPSVDVITGVIKANFPSRIAFQVATKIDSRTIIDSPGAEKLIGRGDLLYLGHGSSEPTRMHNAFLSLEEIDSLMNHISSQPKAEELILESPQETLGAGGLVDPSFGNDSLFNEAVKIVVTHQQGSISLIQRRLKIGYSRAARLIDEMEQAGIVGPFTGSKAREVLVDDGFLDSLN